MLRILLVEDDDYLRETLCALLERDDRALVACASAEAAQAQLAQAPCDVLVTDLNLAGPLSGLELARQVLSCTPSTWVVVSSGYAIDPSALAGLGARARSLPKPFALDEMEQLLEAARAGL